MSLGNATVFVSHKHEDRAIASVFANFIRTESGGKVRPHVSSDPEYDGPHGGKQLCEQLMQALGESGCVILVYTGPGDSDYCMFECGAAVGQQIPIHVFQCCDTDPPPLLHLVRYRAEAPEDVKRFVCAFLTQQNFLRGQDEALTGYDKSDPHVSSTARDLHKELRAAIAKTDERKEEWTPWPSIRLRVDRRSMDEICHPANNPVELYDPDDEVVRMQSLLEEKATVSYVAPDFSLLTGVPAEINDTFSKIKFAWLKKYFPSEKNILYKTICEQMLAAFKKERGDLRAACARSRDNKKVLPVISRRIRYAKSDVDEYELHFFSFPEDSEGSDVIKERKNELVIQIPPASFGGKFPNKTAIIGERSSCLEEIFGIGTKNWPWEIFVDKVTKRASAVIREDIAALLDGLPRLVSDSIDCCYPRPIFYVFSSPETGKQYQPVIERIQICSEQKELTIKFIVCSVPDIRSIKDASVRRIITSLNLANRFRWEIIEAFGSEADMKIAIADAGDVAKLLDQILARVQDMEKEAIERGVYDREKLPLDFGEAGSAPHGRVTYMFEFWERERVELEQAVRSADATAVAEKMRGMMPVNREFVGLCLKALEDKI
jgi:hypothetical protein